MAESAFSNLAFGIPIPSGSIGGMSTLRLIDLNLIYTIKEKILPINGYTSRISETISPAGNVPHPEEPSVTLTRFPATRYDFVYYNPDPANLTDLLTAPTLSVTGDLAFVDYQNGDIYYSGVKTTSITATYDYYTVAVQDGFPDFGEDVTNLEDVRVPLISVDYDSRENEPFALGGKYEEQRMFFIDVVGLSDPMRDDIADIVETSLRYDYTDTIDYNFGFPVDMKGDIDPSFDRGPATRWNPIRFWETKSKVIRDPQAIEKLRHRSLITLMTQTF